MRIQTDLLSGSACHCIKKKLETLNKMPGKTNALFLHVNILLLLLLFNHQEGNAMNTKPVFHGSDIEKYVNTIILIRRISSTSAQM